MKKQQSLLFKSLSGLLFAGLLMFGMQTQAAAQQKSSDNKTVKGEVLDMSCYLAKGAHGQGHQQCAEMCIKGGAPIGLLTSSGKVYLLVNDEKNKKPYESLKSLAADQVTVTGDFHNRNGLPGLVVESVKTD